MEQFLKLDVHMLKELGNLNESIVYAALCDRMESSVQRREFYDKKMQDSYVIYTIEQLSEDLPISKRTVSKVLSSLKEKGLVIIKHQFNAASKIFLPQYTADNSNVFAQSATTGTQDTQSNHTNYKHTNKTYNTNNTQAVEKVVAEKISQPEPQVQNQEIAKAEIGALADSLTNKTGLPVDTVNALATLSFGDPKAMYKNAGLIFKAKNVVKKRTKGFVNAASALCFELNNELSNHLAPTVKRVLLKAGKLSKNSDGYIMTSLINFFEEEASLYMQQNSENQSTEIPMVELV